MSDKIDPEAMPMSADELRMSILQKEMEKMDVERKVREAEEKKLAAFTDEFLHKHVSEDEIAMVRRLVDECGQGREDGGDGLQLPLGPLHRQRAGDQQRRSELAGSTLQGKAKEFFERYEKFGKPQGYKLKAMVINFPGGVPGDIGFFLNWAPPAT